MAAHHFFASSQQPAGLLCKKTRAGAAPARGSIYFAPVAQPLERSPPKAEVVGEIPAGSTIFRASGSEGIADPTDRESVSLGGASPLSPTILLPGRLISRTPPFEGGHVGANPAPAANFPQPVSSK